MTRVSFLVAQFLVRDFFSFKNVANVTPILIFLLVLDFFFYMSSLDFISYFVSTSFIELSGRGGYKRLSLWRVSARSQMLLTERTEQITTLGTPCSTLCDWCVGCSLTSHSFLNNEVLWDAGPVVYGPYPRTVESLTICRCNYKGRTFSSVILSP